jgi:type VI secretion system protein ImpH
MATESRRADPAVAHTLFAEGYRFDFFQAVRVLERLYPERQPIGGDAKPSQEVVRVRSHASLSFPASAIHQMNLAADVQSPAEMTVAFMGLTGPLGVLPRHYTELLLERQRRKDHTLGDFLDLFNHRLVSLLYRAWEKHHFPIAYERAMVRGQSDDRLSQYLLDLIGMGTTGLQGRMEVPDAALRFYAGLLAQRPHSASALSGILQDYFGVPVEVMQFTGQWLTLAPEQRTRLGGSGKKAGRKHQRREVSTGAKTPSPQPSPGGRGSYDHAVPANNALGTQAVLGGRVWDQQAKFTLRLGPLSYEAFTQFLPAGSAFRPLLHLTRFFAGQEHDFAVQLVLKAAEVPRCQLGARGPQAPRLGWSTWLKTTTFTHDADDAVFTAHGM